MPFKLVGVGARGTSQKFGDPYLFLQPLKVATWNLVHNVGLGTITITAWIPNLVVLAGLQKHFKNCVDHVRCTLYYVTAAEI